MGDRASLVFLLISQDGNSALSTVKLFLPWFLGVYKTLLFPHPKSKAGAAVTNQKAIIFTNANEP